VPQNDIPAVMDMFKSLRNMDETVYLRSASFNIVNGIVGLTFSCDGSHYMHYKEFLEWDLKKWFGHSEDAEPDKTNKVAN
jgi:hypothetical protein